MLTGQFCFINSLKGAETSFLMPFFYTTLIFVISLDFGVFGGFRRHLGRRCQTRPPKNIFNQIMLGAILDHVCSNIGFLCILLVSAFIFFVIGFGGLWYQFGRIWGPCWGPLWSNLLILGEMLEEMQNCIRNRFKNLPYCIRNQTRPGPGLGPSPGWGPVRVGAHMGPYGPLC